MLPRLKADFQQEGDQGIALLGPGSKPELPVQGLHLSAGLHVYLYEKLDHADASGGFLHVEGVVAGWNEKRRCWLATYDWDALKWTPELDAIDPEPPFEEWVRCVFDRGTSDEFWWANEETNWDVLRPTIALDYLSRLLEQSSELVRSYSDAQVNQGLWFLVGPASGHFRCLLDAGLPRPPRLRCVRSILNLFDMFAARCSPHLSHLEAGASRVNLICYMFWDLFPTVGKPGEPGLVELDQSLLDVMTAILRLPSDPCRESALHGLGHWQPNYPGEVERIVNKFLAENPTLRPQLRRYAEDARCGGVL